MRDKKLIRALITIYFWSSVLGLLLMIPAYNLATLLLIVGSGSPYIAFMLFCSTSLSPLAGIFAFVWFIVFPPLLVAAYIFTRRESYTYFWILTLIDFIVALLYGQHVLMDIGLTGRYIVGADLVVNIIYISLLTCALKRNHKTCILCSQK